MYAGGRLCTFLHGPGAVYVRTRAGSLVGYHDRDAEPRGGLAKYLQVARRGGFAEDLLVHELARESRLAGESSLELVTRRGGIELGRETLGVLSNGDESLADAAVYAKCLELVVAQWGDAVEQIRKVAEFIWSQVTIFCALLFADRGEGDVCP